MENLEKIFKEVKKEETHREKEKQSKAHFKKSAFVVLGLFFVMSAMLPAVSAQQVWVSDRTDGSGDHVVAVATQHPSQRDPSNARAFIKVEVHYSRQTTWYGTIYSIPVNIDLRIYMDKGRQYIYTSSNGGGHGWASDAWSNPHDTWNVGGASVGIGPWTITLPYFYSVNNIMIDSTNNGHYSKIGAVEWYFSSYDVTSTISAFLHQEKWFGASQGYYIMGGHGQHINYHFHSGVYYQKFTFTWLPGPPLPGRGYWVSYDIYARDNANIVIQ